MFKKLLLAIAVLVATMGFAFAQVDVNKADLTALDGVKGVGPAISKRILDERKKGGDFKDWADLEKRVKGIGEKSAAKLSAAGLTVNGEAKSGAPAAKTDKMDKASAKAEAKKEAKDAKMKENAKPSTPAPAPATSTTAPAK